MSSEESKIVLTEEPVSRRGFLQAVIVFCNAVMALVLAIPGLGFLLTPVLRKGSEKWVELGPVEDFRTDEPAKAVFSYITEAGYTQQQRQGFVWVRAQNGDSDAILALSAVCTHTGCNVAWHPDAGKFICPCHEGTYDIDGQVISGPPPAPLARLSTRIENGTLSIRLPA